METRRRGKLDRALRSLLGAADGVVDFLAMDRHFSGGFDTQSDLGRVDLDLDDGADNFIAQVEGAIFFDPTGKELFGHSAADESAGGAELGAAWADLEDVQL